MPIKMIHNSAPKRTFKPGRKRPLARCPRLNLNNYLTRRLPAPPTACDYTKSAAAALDEGYDNDTLGDCVIDGMADNRSSTPKSEIIALYSAIGGYVPGETSTDQGCDEQTAELLGKQRGRGAKYEESGW
jgi:hypothetical protein